jgi:hypothetical protein
MWWKHILVETGLVLVYFDYRLVQEFDVVGIASRKDNGINFLVTSVIKDNTRIIKVVYIWF